MRSRYAAVLLAVLAAGVFAVVSAASIGGSKARASTGSGSAWSTRYAKGSVRLHGEIPRAVATHSAHAITRVAGNAKLTLSFALPLRNQAGLNKLIASEAKTHLYLTRKQIYARYAPSKAQYKALRNWLVSKGFKIMHLGADRLAIAAKAPTSRIQRVLHVQINDYRSGAYKFDKVKVRPYLYYANNRAPQVPARLGIQSISGLSNVDRFFTDAQIYAAQNPHARTVRGGGYFPTDLRGLLDVSGHGYDGTGQTLGFTLWTAPEPQSTFTAYATATGDTLITKDASCTATGNSPTMPSSCSTATVGADHIMFILENGNVDPGTNFGSNVETGLDIEAAHGVATHSGLKYYASECATNPPPNTGLANAGCNGSDVGMEMAMEDAANDPTLHSVSNSWGYGGEAEWGVTDPFVVSTSNILQMAAAVGTTFYFSTGDNGTFQSGYPTDSPYVVSVGGASTWSTSSPGTWSTTTGWSGGGSWCSTQFARPSWQTGPGVTATASCPGRVSPDESAIADPSTGILVRSAGGNGQVGGTSLAAPVLNGLQAVTQNFVNAQTYPGPTPKIGFVAPLLYQLGNSGHADSYFRDIECGDTANPTSGPDGDAAIKGWDAATGWGEEDWFNFSTGIAQLLGATNVSTPSSLFQHFGWTCGKTPSNSAERAMSCPSTSVCYAVGASSGATPWYGKFIASGAWGAVNTIFKSTDGGRNWFPSNSDMFSIACTSSSTCLTVGAGGRERMTGDGGTTWSDVATAPGNNKPLTQVECPSSSICYAVGDRGNVMKSTDGGQTWSWEFGATYGNPMYGLSCPTTTTCYATDIYAHVFKTTDGGSTWAAQQTPITTPYSADVAETGGPNPWGGLTGISCSDANTCVGVGIYATVSGQTNPNPDPPIITTTDGGATWTRQVSGTGTGNFLQAVYCLPGTQTCWAVGRGGKILTTTNLTTWTAQASGTTTYLNSVTCTSATSCIAVGQGGTVDVYNGSTWTPTTGNGGTGTLADVTCPSSSVCYATGKQGITIQSTDGGATWTQQAGGGSQGNTLNGVSCTSTSTCYAAGAAGQLLKTTNGGQTWTIPASGTTTGLNSIACTSATACTAVGAAASGAAVVRTTTDGTTWNAGTGTGANALTGVSCPATSQCVAVGAAGTARISSDGGATWTAGTTGTTNGLNAVSCPSAAACYADGASGTLLKSGDIGATWSPLSSGTTVALNGVACSDNSHCIVDGASGFISRTANGSSFSQQGDPLSGPTTAQNATSLSLNGATCTSVRCLVGGPAQGDLLYSIVTPTTTATVSPPSPDGQSGWYVTAPQVTLTATAGDFPVASTHYSIDGGPDTVYSGPFSISTDGTHTISYYSVDNVGTMEAAKTLTLKVDLTAPTTTLHITPAEMNGWYASPTVTLNATDGSGSGVDHITYSIDGGPNQTYSGPISNFSTGNHFIQYFATDVAGNVESTKLFAFKADSDKPTVNIVHPSDGDVYKLGAVKNAQYKCADKQSGLASCVGTVPNGSPVDTSTIGTHSFTVTGTDNAGNVTTVTVHYTVVYTFQGFFAPIGNPDVMSLNLVHAGDLIKVGFGLDGDQGLNIGTFSSTAVTCPAWTPHLVKDAGPGTSPGLSFGVASGHYSYGWQTSTAWAGTCREFDLQLNDGTTHSAIFEFFS